ncbi:MAG: MFS transporter [Deltaproteobacteria bacterium]|nr:MAG: MFS transporter [Deltaproteobacteria bacterium]
MTSGPTAAPSATVFGHPAGLFTLFFAEMWERFSYYGMRALLIFYMTKGFLGYGDNTAYGVYGAYTALVYATPFIGGMLADRLLGPRRAIILGGILMMAGEFVLMVPEELPFYLALGLLIVGNGFFKPNISTIVGGLYPEGNTKRDGGFTIFYMGINLGAAMSPLLCAYIGETYGWEYGFGLAGLGMLFGLVTFIAPRGLARAVILLGAVGGAVSMALVTDNSYQLVANLFVGLALVIAAVIAAIALSRGGVPEGAGAPKDPSRLDAPGFPQLKMNSTAFYLGLIAVVLLFQNIIVPGTVEGWIIVAVGLAAVALPWVSAKNAVYITSAAAVPVVAILVQRSSAASLILVVLGFAALGSLVMEAVRSDKVERERLYVVLILMFFSMLFWSFFEQAGSSVNNFTDRNVDRVAEGRVITDADVGTVITMRVLPKDDNASHDDLPLLSQEQFGRVQNGKPFTMDQLVALQQAAKQGPKKADEPAAARADAETAPDAPAVSNGEPALALSPEILLAQEKKIFQWKVEPENVGMGVAMASEEIPASVFQAANPIYIVIFGLIFTALWGFLGKRGLEPSTPVKFALGLVQLAAGFAAFWYGAKEADGEGMVWLGWLLLGYLLHTTGELCLSPVGLSMVVRLSPKRIVSTVMGAWFLATAFSQVLGAVIASLTGVSGEEGEAATIPVPKDTVDVYGQVFGTIAIVAAGAAVVLFILAPLLKRWMHEDVHTTDAEPEAAAE